MGTSIERLLQIMAQLRDPERGCPWDCKQTFASIVPHTLEETYEVVDCIEREDYDHLKEELGDLLFQVVFLARIAEEQGMFSFDDVAMGIGEKLTRRHPHVFSGMKITSEAELAQMWESIKQQERAQKPQQQAQADESVLDNVEATHPALTHAVKLQKAAAKFGFDWPNSAGVLLKVAEELKELAEAVKEDPKDEKGQLSHEMGDVLFTCVNLARHWSINPETSLRKANYRFERRFRYMETHIVASRSTQQEATLDDMERFWQEAKRQLE